MLPYHRKLKLLVPVVPHSVRLETNSLLIAEAAANFGTLDSSSEAQIFVSTPSC